MFDILGKLVIEKLNAGVMVIDHDDRIVIWNQFLEKYSDRASTDTVGSCVFDVFPDLPRVWFNLKLKTVRSLRNYSFTSWQHRPHVFKLPHRRPASADAGFMYQDCAFLPVTLPDGQTLAAIVIYDMTDVALSSHRVEEMSEVNVALERIARTDPLTSAFRRAHCEGILAVEMQRAQSTNTPVSVLMVDVDHFKRVNDTYGHVVGDEVLKRVAQAIRSAIRPADCLGRWGGEEFLIVLPQRAEPDALATAQRIRSAVASADAAGSKCPNPTVSVGVAAYRGDARSLLELVADADAALYQAKREGRDCARVHKRVET